MKTLILTTSCLIVLFLTSSCEKYDEHFIKKPVEKIADNCDLIPAKILKYECDGVVFQLQGNNAFGDAEWEDKTTGVKYPNVVFYHNTCEINTLTNGELSTLYVHAQKTNVPVYVTDCMQCLAITENAPKTKVIFNSISKESCSNIEFQSN